MLVLARKRDQSIIIGDQIEIVVVDISRDQVKLGVSAPRSVSVHRKEVYEEIQQENILASGSKIEGLINVEKWITKRGVEKSVH